MPTKKQLEDNFRYMAASKANYDSREEKYKKAFWEFGTEKNAFPPYDKMSPTLKAEYDKYVGSGKIYGGTVTPKFYQPSEKDYENYNNDYQDYKDGITKIEPLKPRAMFINDLKSDSLDYYERLQMNPQRDSMTQKPIQPKLPIAKLKALADDKEPLKPLPKLQPNNAVLDPLSKPKNTQTQAPTLKPPFLLPTKAEPKVDNATAKQLYEAISKNEVYYDRLNEKGKSVYWNYIFEIGELPLDRLNEKGKAEFEKYVNPQGKAKEILTPKAIQSLVKKSPNELIKENIVKKELPKPLPIAQPIGETNPKNRMIPVGKAGLVKVQPREFNGIDAFVANTVQGAGKLGLSTLNAVNNILQAPATIGVRGKESLERGEGVIKGYGKGIADTFKGENIVSNSQYIENLAPKTTVELKAKYPNAYNVVSTMADFVGIDDLVGAGIIADLSKIKKLNELPTSTADLTRLFEKVKTNTPLTATEKAITDNLPEEVQKKIMYVDPYGNVKNTLDPTLLLNAPKNITAPKLKQIETPFTVFKATEKPITAPKLQGNINPLPKIEKPLLKPPTIQPKGNMSLPKSIINSKLAKPELKAELSKKDFNYNPITNKDTLENARKIIDADYDKAIRIVKEGPASAESNAVGMELVNRLQKENRYTEAIDIIETISKKATESGQAIQALSMWGRLTPEGILKYTQKMFDKANDELTKQGLKAANKLKLTEDFAKDITDRMRAIGSMAEGRAKTVEIAKVLRDIDEQLPKDVWRKVSTIQTMAQLLNPKTMVRNLAGNAIFGGLENVSNVVGTPIDKVISKLTGQRTTILPSLKTQLEAGKVDLVEAVQDALMGIDTKGIGNKFDLGHGPTFKGNTLLGKLEKGLNVGLKATDAGFSGAARAESLRQQMKIAGVTEPTPGMLEIADKVAKYRTFQDKNGLSKGFNDLKAGLNKLSSYFTGTTEWGLGDLVIKYATTPANILARGIEYSPVGTIKAINEAVKPLRGKVFNQKEFVDSIARSVTGTGLIVLGYQLNKMGLITGAADKDKDVAALQRDIGKGEYKLNTTALGRYLKSFDEAELKAKAGDTFASWDWLAPTSIMLGIGANIGQNKGNTSDLLTTVVNATASGMNTIFEQPLLTGVKRFTGGYDQTQNLVNTLQSVPSSFVPSALNQVKQLTDNTTRNTYDPSIAKETLNTVKARIPILSKTLEPRITTLGKQKETFDGGSNNFLNVLLNPSNTSKYEPTPGVLMVLDIYEKSGEKIQFPRIATTYIMDKGEKINLLPAEITKLQTIMGEKTAWTFNRKALDKTFRSETPESQAKKLQAELTKISQEAKAEILEDIRKRIKE